MPGFVKGCSAEDGAGRTGAVLLRWTSTWTWLWPALLAACARALPPPPAPEPPDLVRRHFDQVCRVDSEATPPLGAAELFDTLGLAARLAAVEDRPLAIDRRGDARWHTLDFITRYARSGRPGVAGVWTTTLDSADAVVADSILTARIRPLSGLLRSQGFRAVVVFAPRPTLEVAPPVVCLPHIVHEEGQRPDGLPRGVSTWREFRSAAKSAGSPGQATLRIVLDRQGSVVALDSVAGGSAAVAAARNVVHALRFDPALRNGEPVEGELVQSFAFRRDGPTGHYFFLEHPEPERTLAAIRDFAARLGDGGDGG